MKCIENGEESFHVDAAIVGMASSMDKNKYEKFPGQGHPEIFN